MLQMSVGSAIDYARWVLIALLSIGAGIVISTLLRQRPASTAPVPWALLAMGVGLLPLLSAPVGLGVALNHSESVEFCASCHTPMHAYIADMKDSSSESLAAVHYKNRYVVDNQCYVCHTDSGMMGTIHAKIEGITDLYKYYLGKFRTPIVMRHAYANTFCLKCHGESAKYAAVRDHSKNRAALESGKRPCMDCHGEAAPAHAIRSAKAPIAEIEIEEVRK
jgi:nitrate/TMAO reductase-like tetraheme cytochrome c subunit